MLVSPSYSPELRGKPLTLLTFFTLQLDKILGKTQIHTPGPRRPSLNQLDLGKKK